MTKPRTEEKTAVMANTETKQCPFCYETLAIKSTVCQNCGRDIFIISPAALGWITVAEYAAVTSTSVEEIMSAIHNGDLDGQLVCGTWLVPHE